MKFSTLTQNLQKNLSFVHHAVSSRSQLPILLNLLLEVKEGKLVVSATDLEIGIQTEQEIRVEEQGAATVPARQFTELVAALPEGKIEVEKKGNTLEVRGVKTKSTFQTLPKEEFPKLYEERGEKVISIEQQELLRKLARVVFAASQDVGRPALTGVLFRREKDGMLFVSTDGYRLSLQRHAVENGDATQDDKEILIPVRVLKEVFSLRDTGEVSFFLSRKQNQIVVSQNNATIVGRLIEGGFPDFAKIIPSSVETKSVFDREELLRAIKTGLIFAREAANIVRLSVKKDGIVVSANTPSVGENTVEVEARATGEENEIAFNGRYLLDILGSIEEEEMVFEMTGPLNPGVFKIKDDESFLHLIMPIRVQG